MTRQVIHRRRSFFIMVGIFFLSGFATMKAEDLSPSVPVESIIERGAPKSYDIALHAGEFIQLKVEQDPQLPDVIATVFTPANKQLMAASGITLSSFKLAFIAAMNGTYRLQIQPRLTERNTRCRLIMDAPHPATPTDEEMARASLALHEANQWFARAYSESNLSLLINAIESYQRALELLKFLDDREAEAGAFQHLSTAYIGQKDYENAAQSSARATQSWRIAGNWNGESNATLAEINSNRLWGQYSHAIVRAKDLIERAQTKGDVVVQTRALTSLNGVYLAAGDPEDAIETEQRLLSLEPSPTTLNAATYFENIAASYLTLHEQRTSIDYRMHAVAIYENLGRPKPLASALGRIALGYSILGETQLARDSYDRAVNLDPTQIDPVILARLGRTEQAIPILLQKIGQYHGQKTTDEAVSLLHLADIYAQTKQKSLAIEALTQAEIAWPPNQNPDTRIEFLAAIAMGYKDLGEPAAALPLFQEYLRGVQAKGTEGFPAYPGHLAEMAGSERDLGMLEQSRAHLATALELREVARSGIASSEIGASFFSKSRFIFDVYIDVLMRQGHEAEAFEASERSRAHALISNLGDTISKVREGVDPGLIEEERTLQKRINEAAQQTRVNRTGKTQTIQSNIGQLTAQLELLRGTIRKSNPAYASLTEPASLTLSEIQTKILEPGTTLLEISLSDAATSYVWEVTSETLRGVKLPSRTDIEAAARRLRKSISAGETPKNESPSQRASRLRVANDFTDANSALSRMVLGPLGSVRAGHRLLIVTDGILDVVPFASLLDPKTGLPLIASHEIVKIPSASALAVLREGVAARNAKARNIAILADPVFDAHDERLAASLQSRTPVTTGALSRSLTETGLTIPRLVFSVQEARSIVDAAPQGSTVVKRDFEANRDFASNGSLSGFRIVHFATHGLVDVANPALSGIVLSLVDRNGKAQDGFLRLHDIYNLRLNADLVVLSACETALGSQVNGEGVMSLSRGFFYAGAARVVASLWTVDDQATAKLMGAFYRNMLSNKMSPAAALRAAQQELKQSSRWSSPYYWAAFELQGEWK